MNTSVEQAKDEWIDILDVSAAQGTVDWDRVAEDKVAPGVGRRWRGVIVKVSEGERYIDPRAAADLQGARAAGLLVGAYVYIHPMRDIRKQIETAWQAIGDTMPSFPLALDVEAADPSLTPQQVVDQIRRGRDAVLEHFGRLPMLYSYPSFWAQRVLPAAVTAPDLAELGLWWASYAAGVPWYPRPDQVPHAPEPWRSAGKAITLWQYSGNTKKRPGAWDGHVKGIACDVDRSIFLGGEDAFAYDFCGRPRP